MGSIVIVVVASLLSAVLLGGVVAVVAAPVAVYSSACRSILSSVVVTRVRQDASPEFESQLRPAIAEQWERLVDLADSEPQSAASTGVWAGVLAAFRDSGPRMLLDSYTVERNTQAELRAAAERVARRAGSASPATAIQNGSTWIAAERLRLAWAGLRDFGPVTAGFAIERVGAAVTSATVLGLLIGMPVFAVSSLASSDPPDVGSYLGGWATLGGIVGLTFGAVQLGQRAKRILARSPAKRSPAAWRLIRRVWIATSLAIVVLMALVWWVYFAGRQPAQPQDAESPAWVNWVAGTITIAVLLSAVKLLVDGVREARTWPVKVAFVGMLTSGSLLVVALSLAAARIRPGWVLQASGIVVALALLTPPAASLADWVLSRLSRRRTPVYLSGFGILAVWVVACLATCTLAVVAYFWLRPIPSSVLLGPPYTQSTVNEITAYYVPLILCFVVVAAVCASAGMSHHERNLRLDADQRIRGITKTKRPTPPSAEPSLARPAALLGLAALALGLVIAVVGWAFREKRPTS